MQAFDHLRLITARLHLRPLVPTDVDALFAIFSDAAVMSYWSTPPWTDRAQAVELIATEAAAMAAGQHLRLALARRDDGALVGTCSLFAFHAASRRAEIGYALARAAWGAGLMAEALDALVACAFVDLKLHRLEADIDPRNTASAKSLVRLGFVKEGHLRERWTVSGEVSDAALYGLLRSDWQRRAAAPMR